jgi:hypothetical protein
MMERGRAISVINAEVDGLLRQHATTLRRASSVSQEVLGEAVICTIRTDYRATCIAHRGLRHS